MKNGREGKGDHHESIWSWDFDMHCIQWVEVIVDNHLIDIKGFFLKDPGARKIFEP